jgi:hypothetical protein
LRGVLAQQLADVLPLDVAALFADQNLVDGLGIAFGEGEILVLLELL